MSICGLGLSCEPVKEDNDTQHLPSCIHGSVDYCHKCERKMMDKIMELSLKIEALHEHKLRQIDENRKLSRRVDELDKNLSDWIVAINEKFTDFMQKSSLNCEKRPHKCPRCDASGRYRLPLSGSLSDVIDCHSCEGKGIIWSP